MKSTVSNVTTTTPVSTGFVGYRNFYGSGKFKFFIYPDDNWKKSWGKKPLLGAIYADEPFYAVRESYTKGLVPINVTFGLIALRDKLDEDQITSRRFK